MNGTYEISVNNGIEIEPSEGVYGERISFTLSEGAVGTGQIVFEVVDAINPDFNTSIQLYNPDFCSGFIPEFNLDLSAYECNDNSTSQDSTDDYLSFELELSALGLSGAYNISGDDYFVFPNQGTYEETISFQLSEGSAGADDILVSIVDANDPGFSTSFVVSDTESCSDFGTAVYDIDDFQIVVHPNPFSENLHLSLINQTNAGFGDFKFRLRSINGESVYSQNISERNINLLIPDLAKGIYIYELIDVSAAEILGRGRVVKQ